MKTRQIDKFRPKIAKFRQKIAYLKITVAAFKIVNYIILCLVVLEVLVPTGIILCLTAVAHGWLN